MTVGAQRILLLRRMRVIDRIVPWEERITRIKSYYYRGERGNKPYDLEQMLGIYLLQNLYSLSDPAGTRIIPN